MSFKVEWLECELCKSSVSTFPLLPAAYVFPSGELLRLRRTCAWCNDCRKIRLAEELPDLESLSLDEAKLQDIARTKDGGLGKYEQLELGRVGLFRRLLGIRKHGCRCLTCGGTAIDAWRFDEEGLPVHSPHGGCAGLCKPVDDPLGMRFALVEDAEAYSIDGEYLGRLSDQPGRDGTELF